MVAPGVSQNVVTLAIDHVYVGLGAYLGDPALSEDGNTIYYNRTDTVDSIIYGSIGAVDISNCISGCPRSTILGPTPDVFYYHLSMHGSRIYFYSFETPDNSNGAVQFIEEQSGLWSGIETVVSNNDSDYSDVSIFGAGSAVGRWDHDNDTIAEEILAIGQGHWVDVIDVSECNVSGGSSSCYSRGDASALVRVPDARWPTFNGSEMIYVETSDDTLSVFDLEASSSSSLNLYVGNGGNSNSPE